MNENNSSRKRKRSKEGYDKQEIKKTETYIENIKKHKNDRFRRNSPSYLIGRNCKKDLKFFLQLAKLLLTYQHENNREE
jgi:hypothetical protein